ncbi:MAG: proline dehydrogenase family protein [Chitinophagales bacterium]|nr:proline dehydrogenase family protein [Chitinophagales bacterium]MCZ2394680.1 proline dehydrogenase family protein [Chitinophagales bacterium]
MIQINLNDTECAFQYKSNRILARDYWIFNLMHYNRLVNAGLRISSILIQNKLSLPVILGVKPTVFSLFCGGTSLEKSINKIEHLKNYGVGTILDYGVEAKDRDEDFDKTAQAIIDAILFASSHPSIKIVSSKFTSLIPFPILEKIHSGHELNIEESERFDKCKKRIFKITELAFQNKISLFVDAEESWIQNGLDDLTLELMRKYNKDFPIVYNTFQLYLKNRLGVLEDMIAIAEKEGFILGAKLVRGAYMEKEEDYARAKGIENPIQISKENTDRDYDKAICNVLNHINNVAVCIASHNEESTMYSTKVAAELQIENNHPHLCFSQLLGMSDHISFNMAKAGYRVYKYMPYGPVREVLPYLIRRAQENTSVSDQMGRELQLHQIEMKRRKLLVL